ncbi:MAG: hypothetical protein JO161_08200, partial [Planctomycetaceae bacterium]|nr:hypothetical protein [Planctomycetaceae bacterium]
MALLNFVVPALIGLGLAACLVALFAAVCVLADRTTDRGFRDYLRRTHPELL